MEESDGCFGLLRDDAVAEGFQLLGAGQLGDVGDPAGGEAHEPFDECGVQAASIVSCPGGTSSGDGLPAGDGGGVLAPITFTATSFSGLAFVPMRFDSPDFQSLAAGVGSRCSTSSASVGPCPPRFRFSGCCDPPFAARFAVGVLSSGEEDEPSPGMGSTDVRCAYTNPFRIEPEAGKVSEDGVESEPKVVPDVLKDCVPGS